MKTSKSAWLATGVAVLLMFLAQVEAMISLVVSLLLIMMFAAYQNSLNRGKISKVIIYLILGLMLGSLDAAALYDIGKGHTQLYLEYVLLVVSLGMVIRVWYWEREAREKKKTS